MPSYGYTYRLTEAEYKRYLCERDPLADMFTDDSALLISSLANVESARGKWVVDASTGSAAFDAGFYWVRTTRPIPWV